jgi:uncharacterized membrane protein YgdD (TMEM256/DUF423 family)
VSRSALLGWAAVSGAVAAMAGAFGAHGASGHAAEWLRTGAQYQMVHAVAALAILSRFPRIAGAWLAGGGLFAATLYLMALGGPRWLGAVTPIGGLVMIGGWIALAWVAFRGAYSQESSS